MKKSIKISKRILSLVMAVLMAATCFTFANSAANICEDGKHVPTETKAYKVPTCTEDGWTNELTCRICGELIQQSVPLLKTGHYYDDWIIDIRPTVSNAGSAHTSCIECGIEYSCPIDYIPVTEPTCTNHDFTTGTDASDYIVLVQPTCTMTGVKAHYCRICNMVEYTNEYIDEELNEHIYARYIEIPRIPHSFGIYYITQQATCVLGEIRERKCSVCNYVEEAYDGALGHVWYEWDPEIKGTCQTEAYQTRECDRCGVIQEKYLGYAGPHTMVRQEYVAPTCTETGMTYGLYCSTCHIVDKAQTELAKIPHVDKDKNLLCDNCGAKIDCSCICHKTKGIMGLISRFVIFLWRTFGTSQKCACGIEHYYVYSPAETPTEPTATTVRT